MEKSTLQTLIDSDSLKIELQTVLDHQAGIGKKIQSLKRHANVYNSSFPTEIVTCRFDDGSELHLFLKYGVEDTYTGHGLWGSINYSQTVHRDILEPLSISKPRYYGGFSYDNDGHTCLVLEYMRDALRLAKSPKTSLALASRWLGKFHALNEDRVSAHHLQSIRRYDEAYFVQLLKRTLEFSMSVRRTHSWLPDVCKNFEDLVPTLLKAPMTIIHGEFYPHNILVRDNQIFPVDWQTAAIACGEIDLASLLEGWWRGLEIVQRSIQEYKSARWPSGAPETFEPALRAATLYWPFRWLGDKDYEDQKKRQKYIGDLFHLARERYVHSAGDDSGIENM